MKTFRFSLLLLLLAGSFWSCTDHRNSPLAPQRLRLKATDTGLPGGRVEYTYDQMGRLASVFQPGVSRAVFTYDEQDRVLRYDNKSETSAKVHRVVFTYSSGNALVRTYESDDNGVIVETEKVASANTGTISFRTDGRINLVTTGEGLYIAIDSYNYTGSNITSVKSTNTKTRFDFAYEYDDKPNPFYGLITPYFDGELRYISTGEILLRSNRNNVTKSTFTDQTNGIGVVKTDYQYEYNAQGLPTKVRAGQNFERTFTYESY